MRISLLDSTAEFAAPVGHKNRKVKVIVQLRNIHAITEAEIILLRWIVPQYKHGYNYSGAESTSQSPENVSTTI